MKIVFCDLLGLTYDGSTLKSRGLGGSESAVILLASHLASIGFDVTIFNNCIDSAAQPGVYDGVQYIDHSQLKTYTETPDIFISSRTLLPFWAGHSHSKLAFSAKKRILWMHDTFAEGEKDLEAMIVGGFIDEVFTLSDFHTNYALNCDHGSKRNFEVLKHKFWQTRNGAVKHIQEVDLSQKDPNHYVYNASVTKGLVPLLSSIWPEVKKQLPAAKLTVIGGYYRFCEGAEPDAQEKILHALMQQNHKNVTFTGVIPQHEIATILANASYTLYPTAFPETFGISSLESLLYKTPIITSRFGALEETAIDLACYKIEYSATKNVLFKNIDERQQTKNYVQTIVNAAKTPYLHQQKQNYCDVISDIYGWDTVALQWKQHFYTLFDKPLPVREYRKVTLLNDKVARVFGRRYNNIEQRKQYRSYGSQKRIVVISPFWNAENYIEKHIRSVAQQDYDNYLHILINDASTDNTRQIAEKTIKQVNTSSIVLINREINRGAIFNQLSAIREYTTNDDIVILLDGDDWLINNNTLFRYYNDLYSRGYEFTYGSMWSVIDNIPLIAQDYPLDVKKNKSYRQHQFNWKIPYTHLRTCLGKHFDNLEDDTFKVNGQWMKSGADNPLFYELIEKVDPNKIYCNQEIVCNYNDANPLNDYKIHKTEQNNNAALSYKETPSVKKRILVAIPTAKYIEVETFKSLWDLTVPEGYKLDFQYFYGYSIDQIRNLIADWAKQYDYLLSVDSDIILPKDSLVKMLAADKDIISGLYIQRIPNTQTVELYMSTTGGGCTNIPYALLENRGVVEIEACGMGAALIKGEVFKKIKYPHFYYKSALEHVNTISEDVYFCKKAKQAGFTVWADTSIKCDHVGATKFSLDTQIEKNIDYVYSQDLLPKQHVKYLENIKTTPKVIYDIGSCVLHWERHARARWPDAEIYLFEANRDVKKLYDKTNKNYYLGVLTDTDNKAVTFYKDPMNLGGNSYYKENTVHYNETHAVHEIGKTLDTIIADNNWPLPDLIKIDVQGAELDILKGAQKCLIHCTDILLEAQHVEYNIAAPKLEEIQNYLQSLGYNLVASFSKNTSDGDYHFVKIIK